MSTLNLLYKKEYRINDYINIIIPTVGEVIDNEDEYFGAVSLLTAMPIDFMLQLSEMGIDFCTINEYELFLLFFEIIKASNTKLIFDDLDLSNFKMMTNKQNGNIDLFDETTGAVIDRAIHNQIATVLRKINHLEKNHRKPANKEAKEYMLLRAKEKAKRNKNRKVDSEIESLIVALVNTEQYKYDFEATRELSIYQFNESVRQVIKKVDYDNKMYGIYTGTIRVKDIPRDDLNWLSHK